jgi:hypothetical protein
VKSSNVDAAAYDADGRRLSVRFKGGGIYHFADVPPEKADGLLNADSPGRYFAENIKGQHEHVREDKSDG